MQLVNLARPFDWDDQLLSLFGIPREHLPVVCRTTDLFGHLRCAHIRLRAVCGDQFAALHGAEPYLDGAGSAAGNERLREDVSPVTPRPLLVNLGTGGFVMAAPATTVDPSGPLLHSPGALGERIVEGTINGVGAALQWAAQRLGVELSQVSWPTAYFNARDWTFVNRVGGVGSPWWHAAGNSYWIDRHGSIGQPADATAAMQAVLESIAFLVHANVDCLGAAGVAVASLRLTGGVAAIRPLGQLLADLCHCPVETPAETELTARTARPGLPPAAPRTGGDSI